MSTQALPGFREWFPEDFACRSYIVETWRRVARRFGFREIEGPLLEPLDLYRKKNRGSGAEILAQLYQFTDKGGREVALRPEMTPTLARMAAHGHGRYKKPLKWFSVGSFFRYERPQKGRLREFLQLNADVIGEPGVGADAEVIALGVEILRELGLGPGEVAVRVSDRRCWVVFLRELGVGEEKMAEFLAVVDKLGREPDEVLEERLRGLGGSLDAVRGFLKSGRSEVFEGLLAELDARGVGDSVVVDLTVVRGLAYYTGTVFEFFDREGQFRAVAGGGRYDHLIGDLSDGAVELPAVGLGMGDAVLQKLLESHSAASEKMRKAISQQAPPDIFVVVADEMRRKEALGLASTLRREGWRVEMPLSSAKVGRQFAAAEECGARHALVVGTEWPAVRWKVMALRQEKSVLAEEVSNVLKTWDVAQKPEMP